MNKNRVVKNASWIIGIQIVKSLLGLVISMLTARFLGPSNFGLINYAASIVAFVTPIHVFGLKRCIGTGNREYSGKGGRNTPAHPLQ